MDKLHNKDFQIAFKTGSDANKSKFAKECVHGELYLSDEALYIAGSTADVNDAALSKYQGLLGNSYSISLDGTNDYMDCGGDSDFSFTDGSGNDSAFSISAWVKLDANNRSRVVGKGDVEWLFGTNANNKLSLYLWSNDTTTVHIAQEENTALATGAWHHIVATYDGSNNASGIKIYRAGSLVTMSNASSGSYAGMASQQGSLRIGQWELNASVMDGLVDEVAVFNSELSASDVTAIYNNGVPNGISSLSPLGWWRMGDNNGGTGTTITDQGSGGNNGTLVNGPTFSSDVPS